jgi:hypothetical protein
MFENIKNYSKTIFETIKTRHKITNFTKLKFSKIGNQSLKHRKTCKVSTVDKFCLNKDGKKNIKMITSFVFPTFLVIFLNLFFSSKIYSYYEQASVPITSMNGISYKDYKDFSSSWKLVTVRYREDSKEIRLVYANAKAWLGLQKMKPSYDNGSAFGKIALLVSEDPSFPSSLVPSATKRFQIMVKDKNKYKNTDGWGYALFNSEGKVFKDDIQSETMACAACHRVVPERDFVFSRISYLDTKFDHNLENEGNSKKILIFKDMSITKLSKKVKKEIKEKTDIIHMAEGELLKNVFSGTLDEIIPSLIKKTKSTGKPSLFYFNDLNYSIVEKKKSSCANKQELKISINVVFNGNYVRNNEICY